MGTAVIGAANVGECHIFSFMSTIPHEEIFFFFCLRCQWV